MNKVTLQNGTSTTDFQPKPNTEFKTTGTESREITGAKKLISLKNPQQNQPTAVPIAIDYGIYSENKGVKETIDLALRIVDAFQPKRNNILNWPNYKSNLGVNQLNILFMTNEEIQQIPDLYQAFQATNSDSATMLAGYGKNGKIEYRLSTILNVDKIFYNTDGSERQDGFARLVVALSHQLYGNVDHYLDNNNAEKFRSPQTREQGIEAEINGFEQSIAFWNA